MSPTAEVVSTWSIVVPVTPSPIRIAELPQVVVGPQVEVFSTRLSSIVTLLASMSSEPVTFSSRMTRPGVVIVAPEAGLSVVPDGTPVVPSPGAG